MAKLSANWQVIVLACVSFLFSAGTVSAQVIDPTTYPGADLCLKIQAAITANAPTYPLGLIIDARSATGAQPCSVNPFSGSPVPGQLLLGNVSLQVTAPIVTPSVNQWQILGVGRNSTMILAVTGFPVNGVVVRLGDGTAVTFGNRVENLSIDCNDTAGAIGLYSSDIQEQSGASNVVVANCPVREIWINGSGSSGPGVPAPYGVIPYADNYDLHDMEGYTGTSSSPSQIACEFDGNAQVQGNGPHMLDGITCIGGTGGIMPHIAYDFVFDGIGGAFISNMNAENADTGYLIGNNAPVVGTTFSGLQGLNLDSDLVHVKNVTVPLGYTTEGVMFNGIFNGNNSVPVTLQDDVLGRTITSHSIGTYTIGERLNFFNRYHLSTATGDRNQLPMLSLDTQSDTDNVLFIASGSTMPKADIIELDDRGVQKWNLGKDTLGNFQLFDSVSNLNRMYVAPSSATLLNSAGSGPVVFNSDVGSGTGGIVVSSGGATPASVASINGSGDATVNSITTAGVPHSLLQDSILTFYQGGTNEWNMGKDIVNAFQIFDFGGNALRFYAPQGSYTAINAGGSAAIQLNFGPGSGTGGVIFGSGGASATTVAAVNGAGAASFTSVAGSGAASFTLGSSSVVGSGASISCKTSHVCDSYSGTVALTTGSGLLSTGVALTITLPLARTNVPNCTITFTGVTAAALLALNTSYLSTSSLAIATRTSLATANSYDVTYVCGGN